MVKQSYDKIFDIIKNLGVKTAFEVSGVTLFQLGYEVLNYFHSK